jgi:hypothetical protein
MEHVLLIVGLIFPAISWLSVLGGHLQSRATGKSCSGVYVPFIGPILIDLWLHRVGAPGWTMLVPWITDIGTLFFLWLLPAMLLSEWRTSRFTRTMLLAGAKDNQSVKISFHKGGDYVMYKTWHRPDGEFGITGLGEPGSFESESRFITLTSHTGSTRKLIRIDDGFVVEDSESPGDYSLDKWILQRQPA